MQAVPDVVHYVFAENDEHSSCVFNVASEHYCNLQKEAVPGRAS